MSRRTFTLIAFFLLASVLLSPPLLANKIQAARGGDGFESAVPLEMNHSYRLDHHQKIGYFDYFVIELEPGAELLVELVTGNKGINLRENPAKETDTPYAGITLYNKLRQKIDTININGKAHQSRILRYNPSETGQYYIVVGSTFDDMHKDHTLFKVILAARGDLDGDVDAGNSLTEALPIASQRYETNYLGGADFKDVFSFDAKKGEVYFIGLIPNEETGSSFAITVYDNYKQRIFSKTSGINEGLKSKEFTIPDDGTYYIEVILGSQLKHPTVYTLELNQSSPALQASPKASPEAAPQQKAAAKRPPKPNPLPAPEPKDSKKPTSLDDEGPRAMPTPTELPASPEPESQP